MFKSEKGTVIVMVALSMMTLMMATALVADVGRLYLAKIRLQAGADAAALAAATTLFSEHNLILASNTARGYVNQNVHEYYKYNYQADQNQNSFTVNLEQDVAFFFAPIMGINTSKIKATATAKASTIISALGVVPFGVEQQNFEFGEQYTLKYGAGDKPAHGGNFGGLALGGNGANTYRDNIKYGYNGELEIGQQVTTKPGNMAGPTDQGVSYRISQCTHGCSYNTQIEANCPRVVITPIINAIPDGGRTTATIVGFAAFFLEATQDGAKGQKDVIGRFLKWATPGKAGDGTNYGLSTVSLTK